jgi:transposase-like protein
MEQRDGSSEVLEKKRQIRRSWTPAQKREIVAQSQVAGASLSLIARRHGIRTALIASWRRQLSRNAKRDVRVPKFAAVRMSAMPSDGVIEVDLQGGCVRIRGIVDGAMLREVLAATR